MSNLDAYASPPDVFRAVFKRYRKISRKDLSQDGEVVDMIRKDLPCHMYEVGKTNALGTVDSFQLSLDRSSSGEQVQIYASNAVEGLRIIPGLLNITAQRALLDRLLHRDLSNRQHQTNVSKHYHIPYDSLDVSELGVAAKAEVNMSQRCQGSFFTCDPNSGPVFKPLDPNLHMPISVRQFLDRKLRWMTLGGQYDWTKKIYPDVNHPHFPPDIAEVIQSVFPEMKPESAICNVYSPGDTLSLHRDVSEDVDAGLVSLSIGCDALFVVGLDATGSDRLRPPIILRLRSGDAIYMSGPSRYAWHGVPQVIAETCPNELSSWPAASIEVGESYKAQPRPETEAVLARSRDEVDPYSLWHSWIRSKRVNLNVRQMRA